MIKSPFIFSVFWLIAMESMENDPFIDDLPIEVVISHSYVSLPEGNVSINEWQKKDEQTIPKWEV
jgi:hypothetical protein